MIKKFYTLYYDMYPKYTVIVWKCNRLPSFVTIEEDLEIPLSVTYC